MGALQDHSPGSGIFEIYFLLDFLLWSKTLLQCLDALKVFVYLTFNMFWLIFHFLPFHIHYSTLVGQHSMVWVTLLLPQVANHFIENPRSSCDAETTWPTPTASNLFLWCHHSGGCWFQWLCLPPWQGFQFGHSHLWAQCPEWPHSAWPLGSGVLCSYTQIQVCLVMAHQLILVFLWASTTGICPLKLSLGLAASSACTTPAHPAPPWSCFVPAVASMVNALCSPSVVLPDHGVPNPWVGWLQRVLGLAVLMREGRGYLSLPHSASVHFEEKVSSVANLPWCTCNAGQNLGPVVMPTLFSLSLFLHGLSLHGSWCLFLS